MSTTILITISEGNFKTMLKECIREVLQEMNLPTGDQWPEKLNVEQAAKFLDIEVNTLYAKTAKRLIPFYKKGKKIHFYLSELRKWLEGGKVKTAEALEGEAITYSLTKKK